MFEHQFTHGCTFFSFRQVGISRCSLLKAVRISGNIWNTIRMRFSDSIISKIVLINDWLPAHSSWDQECFILRFRWFAPQNCRQLESRVGADTVSDGNYRWVRLMHVADYRRHRRYFRHCRRIAVSGGQMLCDSCCAETHRQQDCNLGSLLVR